MKPTIKLVSNHRIDPEKWWWLILSWLKNTLSKDNLPFAIKYDIFGDGKLKEQVVAIAHQYPESITYHGFVSIHKIFSWSMDYDFVIMPSLFLETFGLSALDFAQFGVPVIGYKKGGVAPFILDNLNISAYSGANGQEQFDNAMNQICNHTVLAKQWNAMPYRTNKDEITQAYSMQARIRQFKQILTLPWKQSL